jgi:hypothetical protein
MAHAHFRLDNFGYKHKIGVCNIYSFPAAKMAAGTHTNTGTYCGISKETNS